MNKGKRKIINDNIGMNKAVEDILNELETETAFVVHNKIQSINYIGMAMESIGNKPPRLLGKIPDKEIVKILEHDFTAATEILYCINGHEFDSANMFKLINTKTTTEEALNECKADINLFDKRRKIVARRLMDAIEKILHK